MKLLVIFIKTLREQTRDLWALSLSLVLAPFLVFIYYLFTAGASTTYTILVIDQDGGPAAQEVIRGLGQVRYSDGSPILKVISLAGRAEAESRLRNRSAAALLILPPHFSEAVSGQPVNPPPEVIFSGDLTNPYYAVAAVMASSALEEYLQTAAGIQPPVQILEQPLGNSAARSEFEIYVPGLMIFAILLLIFVAAMTVSREVEAGTLRRLQITRMSSFDFLGGVSLAVVLFGLAAVALTFLTALALGFRSSGPLWLAVLVACITSLSVVAVGLLIACFSHTVSQAFLIANFPFGIFMFFSGAAFPLPRVALFTLRGQSVALYDLFPATHAVNAFNKIFTLGAGLSDIGYELSGLVVLTAVYFAAGVWLFQRKHLRPGN